MAIVRFYDDADDSLLKFAVIAAVHQGRMLFCKHRERDTLEIPGGHREPGESIDETAARELREETGAIQFTITPVCVYSVTDPDNFNGQETFGKLYFAESKSLSTHLHNVVMGIVLNTDNPENWTYPQIQPCLIDEIKRRQAKP